MGLRVWGCGVWGLGFTVWGGGVSGLGFKRLSLVGRPLTVASGFERQERAGEDSGYGFRKPFSFALLEMGTSGNIVSALSLLTSWVRVVDAVALHLWCRGDGHSLQHAEDVPLGLKAPCCCHMPT